MWQCERLLSGLTKLVEAGDQLAVLNEKLAQQRVAVVEKTVACDELLNEITAATLRTEDKKTLAVDKGREAEDQSKDIEMEKVHTLCQKVGVSSFFPSVSVLSQALSFFMLFVSGTGSLSLLIL